jgi:hypothetical protein
VDTLGPPFMSEAPENANRDDPFGLYRAEWLGHDLFQLFKKPNYYPELETARPCVLVGGRGTGKTTVLRCLSYDGRYELENSEPAKVNDWAYFGFYHRVNTNRVTAFRGEELNDSQWIRAFAHYVNLLLCGQVLNFLHWYYELFPDAPKLPADVCQNIAESLFIEECSTTDTLRSGTDRALRRFEGFLNNIDSAELPTLSVQGRPVDELCSALQKLEPFSGRSFFFIIDEFENYLSYQQEVMNTLIKHCGTSYTFKVGMKDLGWRKRSTLNPDEQLISPADYELIDISQRLEGDLFEQFASEVCNLRAARTPDFPTGVDIQRIFPALSIDDEAKLLGVDEYRPKILDRATTEGVAGDALKNIPTLELYFVDYWADSQKKSLCEVLAERGAEPESWRDRYNNYKVAILFTIRAGKPGLTKYYSGWDTYVRLADANIRYLLELINQARKLHERSGGTDGEEISPEVQTKAAQLLGRKNISELEGLSVQGAQLTKLLLGLGRVFEVLAQKPQGHSPEYNQFHLSEDAPLGQALPLLNSAVMHLALVRTVSNKRMDADPKSYDYSVHPIFAPFFVFSHRRKRKIRLTPHQLLALVEEPKATTRQILRQFGKDPDGALPDQLQLFESYYREAE